MAENEEEFEDWLEKLGRHYTTLSTSQCDRTLDHLINVSQSAQLYHLSELLSGLLKRDFIGCLPQEVVNQILCHLDAGSLLRCCVVSRSWQDSVDSCTEAWRRVCHDAGLATNDNSHQAAHWKHRYQNCSRRLASLRRGDAFHQKMLFGHTDRVMAVYYHNGLLATGSDDHSVRVWDCATGRCMKIIQTHTVAELKFDSAHLFTASFDTTAACWDMLTGELRQRYSGHVAAVFSVDFYTARDMVITGSADSTVKVWSLTTGQLSLTLPHHRSNWIMQVRLLPQEESCVILSRDNVSIHEWRLTVGDHGNPVVQDMREWNNPHSDLVPGLQVRGDCVSYACVDSDNVCYVMENDLQATSGSPKQRKSHRLVRDTYAQAYLGSGARYDVILSQGDRGAINIVRHSDHQVLTSVTLPSDYRQSKRMSTFTLGVRSWLDGFDGDNADGIVFVTSLRDNSVMLLEWSKLDSDMDTL